MKRILFLLIAAVSMLYSCGGVLEVIPIDPKTDKITGIADTLWCSYKIDKTETNQSQYTGRTLCINCTTIPGNLKQGGQPCPTTLAALTIILRDGNTLTNVSMKNVSASKCETCKVDDPSDKMNDGVTPKYIDYFGFSK